MQILLAFKDQKNYSFEELLTITNLTANELDEKLSAEVKRKRLTKQENNYILKAQYQVGKLDLKEGFGFLLVEGGDLYLEDKDLKNALDGDLVLVRRGLTNKVIEVLKRASHSIVCTVKKVKSRFYLIPKKPLRLPVELSDDKSLIGGEVLLVRLTHYYDKVIRGEIEKLIGFQTDPDIDVLALVYEFGFPYEFSKEALIEVEALNKTIDYAKRLVIKDEYIVTIDGEDAKDLDDAISLKKLDDHYYLSVHIADVSSYVKENSAIDKAALKRATSAYLADRVIPMLPRKLSNDLCSLSEKEEKYALSVLLKIDLAGNIVDYQIKETVINVKRRLTYNEVNAFFKGKSLTDKSLEKMLSEMRELSEILKNKRSKRGMLEFESIEYQYILNENNDIIDIVVRQTGIGEEIIESLMILTNELISEHLSYLNIPCIYRIHEKPNREKLIDLFAQLEQLDIKVPRHKRFTAKTLQTIINAAANHPQKLVIHEMLLQAMNKAKYARINLEHFGLASKFYSHFTAPIRRYPDLLLHRIVKDFLIDPTNLEKKVNHYENIIEEIAIHSSLMEKKADDLEREVDKLKIAQFMEKKIGEVFKAAVVKIMKTGMFVKTEKGIEGMIPLRILNDYYHYDEKTKSLINERTKEVFAIGKTVTVKLIDVKIDLRQLTFQLLN
ncbi:MAG: ribonuclease R [Acholeplasmataceae bacterium]|nr:ribonuclease R [Acholeplasmataceae bacterium]